MRQHLHHTSTMVLHPTPGLWYWRSFHKYVAVRYGTAAPYVQFAVGLSTLFYCINYKTIRLFSHAKYH
ncbi:hypothetical protein BV898_14089 [Hypsibius exemplaris]|uniref:ATP synthase subunit f, mitochondrial n=1 Tax=Hypsibius exemplaris TaxID=2072580 RepID=A0A1W0W8U4_HYPEX|nr:hypothetical protein BV898_14089 [Hypsibius exemplaris]